MKKNQHVLGIDIGDKNMKLSVINHKKGITTVVAYEEYDVESFIKNGKVESHDYIRDCIKTFLKDHKISKPKVILTIPNKNGDCSYTKIFDMKKLSKKEHIKALPIEIEDRFPIKDFNDYIQSHHVLGPSLDGKDIQIIAVLAKKEIYNSYLEIFNDDKLSKLEVIVQSKTVSMLNNVKDDDSVHMIVDIGFDSTEFILSKGQKPLMVKSINFGGNIITEMISRMLNISIDEAENLKQTEARILKDNEDLAENDLQRELSEIIFPQLNILFSEMEKTIDIAKSKLNVTIDKIYTCGGTSKLTYLNEYIDKRFKLDVQSFVPYFLESNQDVNIKYGGVSFIASFGSSFQAYKQPLTPLIFTPPNLVKTKRFVLGTIATLLFILVGLNGTLFVQLKSIEKTLDVYNRQHQEYQEKESQYSSEYNSLESSKAAKEEARIRKEKESYQLAQLIKSKVDHVKYLQVIRNVVPVTVQTNEIKIDKFDLTIRGLAGTYSDIGYFVKELTYRPEFKDIDFSYSTVDKSYGKYILRYFSFEITGKIVHP